MTTLVREELGPLISMRAVVAGPGPADRDDIRWRADLGGGALMDLGCYGVHALRTLAGCTPIVGGVRSDMDGDVDTAMSADLRFDSCPNARMECTFLTAEFINTLRIVGERGMLEVKGFMLPQVGGWTRLTQDGITHEEPLPPGTTFAAQLDHVVDVLAGRTEPLTGGEDAVANMLVLDAIRAACTARS
jgi:predicted dehydrogenase